MAITTLKNEAISSGYVNDVLTNMTAAVTVQLIAGLTITKTADRTSWATGVLTYTIKVFNDSGVPYTNLTISDMLDHTKVALVPNSVTFDDIGVNYTYDAVTGILNIIPVPQLDLPDGETAVFTFQVTKV